MKVGVEGRVLLGPAGTPGNVPAPVRVAIISRAEGRPPSASSIKFPLASPPDSTEGPFTIVTEPLSVPVTSKYSRPGLHDQDRLRFAGQRQDRGPAARAHRHHPAAGGRRSRLTALVTARRLHIAVERFPIAGAFVISRGAKTEAVTVVATIEAERRCRGRGECVPYSRYGESVESVVAQIENLRGIHRSGDRPRRLAEIFCRMAPPATRSIARSGISKPRRSGVPAFELAGLAPPAPVITAYTLSLDTPEAMAAAARAAPRPLLKLKLGGDGDAERLAAVRAAAPDAAADRRRQRRLVGAKPRRQSRFLRGARRGADRTAPACGPGRDPRRGRTSRPALRRRKPARSRRSRRPCARRYEAINIKLDKAGGLTEALALADAAEAARLPDHDRLHGGELARHGARPCCSPAARDMSISTGRCCWRATGPRALSTRGARVLSARTCAVGMTRAVKNA